MGTRFHPPVPSLDWGLWLAAKTIAIDEPPWHEPVSSSLTVILKSWSNGNMSGTWKIEKRLWQRNSKDGWRRKHNNRKRNPNPPLSRQREQDNSTGKLTIDTGPPTMAKWERSIALITTGSKTGLFGNNVNGEQLRRAPFVNKSYNFRFFTRWRDRWTGELRSWAI